MKTYLPFKAIFSILVMVALLITACEDDEVTTFEPTELMIIGPEEVSPGDTATYIADRYENETYSWTVPAGATLTSGDGTPVVTVTFTAAGSGDISVAARGIEGSKTVDVVTAAPMASIALDSGVVLTEGGTANVLITFDQDIAVDPEVSLVPAEGVSGSTVSALEKVDDRTFRVSYTAGAGDGTDQISIEQAVTSVFFGSVAMDTVLTFDGYMVDNTAATGELSSSQTPVSDDMMVTLSAIFSETLSTSDTVKVSINGVTTDAAYVTNANMTTEDGITWIYAFQPEGGANELASVSVSNLPADLAGNPTEAVEPIIIQLKND
ncbi:hypothetical protein [Catalinimonas niigatensis]|uniref:hypothetical protein n=1 Tax=Catalinimonas niigatensis TaxID=1397264 RepID=UPI0026656D22|nr:hypothetical protein [Catalinimonas niigatensis]WPP48804.1 hypothetical protein PZB72_19235 [Catalinimonas niigatensis]